MRVALIDGQWVAFPTVEQLETAVFDMVVAGRVVGDDVAIMMVEAEATDKVIELVAGGAQAPTEAVTPMSHPMPLVNVTRPDQIRPSLTPQEALAGAPESDAQRFSVPRILDED